jgi:predicted O-linked N-acetylglucosamine transferase (SPINDLY family)
LGLLSRLIGRASPGSDETSPSAERHDAAHPSVEKLIEEGNTLEDQGRPGDALERYEAAVSLAPESARPHMNRANALSALGRLGEARQGYAKAVSLKPDYGAAHCNLGNVLWRLGQREEALGAYRQALAAAPDMIEAELAVAMLLQDLGRLQESSVSYARVIQNRPHFARAHRGQGMALAGLGRFGPAADSFRTALSLEPGNAETLASLGHCYAQLGRMADAEDSFRHALAVQPDATAHYNLAVILQRSGKAEEAIESYRSALVLDAAFVDAIVNLGALLDLQGNTKEAIDHHQRALSLAPGNPVVHYGLGNALMKAARRDEALASYQRALELDPDFPEALLGIGNVLRDRGDLEEAASRYRQSARARADFAEAHFNLANTLRDLGRLEEAKASYGDAIRARPGYAAAHHNLGNVLKDMRAYEDACASYLRAVELSPTLAGAWTGLGTAQACLARFDLAVESHRCAIGTDPVLPEAHANLADAYYALGLLDESIASYRKALELNPALAQSYTGLFFSLCHHEGTTSRELFNEHRRFGLQFETEAGDMREHVNARDPARVLRIGFVSADLRDHAVATFLEPVLPHLAGNRALSLHAYYNYAVDDAVTARLRRHFAQWSRVRALSDDALCDRIRADGIDILVDLSGHSAGNRLTAFARKPAPIQASWLGYPATTGLAAMDYYLCTRHFLPPDEFADQFTERLVLLPASAPFALDASCPEVRALPALANGYLTFGSFNRISKLREPVIELWCGVFKALPSSRLLLGSMPPAGQYQSLLDTLDRHGMEQARLRIEPRRSIADYLALHNEVDLCLDTFPYAGGTTTAHALQMGVPTVTLAGSTPASRQGAAMLGSVGLEQFVAHDADEFRRITARWGTRTDELAAVRAGLRKQCEQSLMHRADVIAASLAIAFRRMWELYCLDRQPQQLEITGEDVPT